MMLASSEMTELLECAFGFAQIPSNKGIEPSRRFFCLSLNLIPNFKLVKQKFPSKKRRRIVGAPFVDSNLAAKDTQDPVHD